MNKFLYRIAIILTLFTPALASAYELITPIGNNTEVSSLEQYIEAIYTYGLGFGALVAIAMITWGGVQYTVSESISNKEDAKDRITKAILGLALLLIAALILQTINPDILKTTLPGLEAPKPTQTFEWPNIPQNNIPEVNGEPLYTVPENNLEPSCGNSIKEFGEECDPPGFAEIVDTGNGGFTSKICSPDCKLVDQ